MKIIEKLKNIWHEGDYEFIGVTEGAIAAVLFVVFIYGIIFACAYAGYLLSKIF